MIVVGKEYFWNSVWHSKVFIGDSSNSCRSNGESLLGGIKLFFAVKLSKGKLQYQSCCLELFAFPLIEFHYTLS